MSRKEFRDLADPEEARAAIASLELAPDDETVPLRAARGRVLAERVDAGIDVPGFDRASVDGYAVRAEDTFGADEAEPAELALVGSVHAGTEPDLAVGEGQCATISTGAVVPPGADAVVMVERTDRVDAPGDGHGGGDATEADVGGDEAGGGERGDGSTGNDETGGAVLVRTSVAPGDGVMFAGADVAAGERALGPGTRLTPREIGLLAALGVDEVSVRGVPTVGIVSTGDELVRPGEPLDDDAGEIHDVNTFSTAAAVEETGCEARVYPHAGDDREAMAAVLREAAAECDLVLSSGSTSASAVDVVYRVIEERGELLLHGVAVKPGKPMLVGRLEGSAYVGLPGYPVSALTIFRTFVAPALRAAAGLPAPEAATVEGRMAARERYAEGRLRYMPVGLVEPGPDETPPVPDRSEDGPGDDEHAGDDELLVYPVDRGSGATTSLVVADGVVAVQPDVEYLEAGERVTVELFSADVRPPTVLGAGEDDPALSRLLDRLERPRYLAVGSRQGRRRLRGRATDVAVTTAPAGDADGADGQRTTGHPDATGRQDGTTVLGGWTREWGLVVPDGNPLGLAGVADLVDGEVRFVNRTTDSGLRATLEAALAALADERGRRPGELHDAVDGWELAVRAHESPARKVLAGTAAAGLGLRATAESLGTGFVPCGRERVSVIARDARLEKPGVQALAAAVDDVEDVLQSLAGYRPR